MTAVREVVIASARWSRKPSGWYQLLGAPGHPSFAPTPAAPGKQRPCFSGGRAAGSIPACGPHANTGNPLPLDCTGPFPVAETMANVSAFADHYKPTDQPWHRRTRADRHEDLGLARRLSGGHLDGRCTSIGNSPLTRAAWSGLSVAPGAGQGCLNASQYPRVWREAQPRQQRQRAVRAPMLCRIGESPRSRPKWHACACLTAGTGAGLGTPRSLYETCDCRTEATGANADASASHTEGSRCLQGEPPPRNDYPRKADVGARPVVAAVAGSRSQRSCWPGNR